MRKNQNKFQINQSGDVEAQDLSLLKPLPIHDHNLKINCGCGSTRENRKLTDKRLQSGGRAVGTTTETTNRKKLVSAEHQSSVSRRQGSWAHGASSRGTSCLCTCMMLFHSWPLTLFTSALFSPCILMPPHMIVHLWCQRKLDTKEVLPCHRILFCP